MVPSVTNYERFQKTMDAIHSRSKVVLRRVLLDLFLSDISDPETLQSRIHELVAERYEYMYVESNEKPTAYQEKERGAVSEKEEEKGQETKKDRDIHIGRAG